MAARMQQRRGTASQWTSANPILGSGEIGFETDTNKFKIGNGQTVWASLPYFANVNDIVDGAPDLLNTLNELAAALGDDPSFITTINTNLGQKADISYVDQEIIGANDTAQGYANDAESNAEAYTNAVIGDPTVTGTSGNTVTARIAEAVAGIVNSSPETLDALNELAAALGNDPNFATTVSNEIGTKVSKSGDTMSGFLTLSADPTSGFHAATKGYVDGELASLSDTLETADGVLSSSINTTNNDLSLLSSQVQTLSDDVTNGFSDLSTEIQTLSDDLNGDINTISSQVGSLTTDVQTLQIDLADLESDLQDKAPINSPNFTGTAVLPSTTSIGDVSSSEIGHLNGVTSSIQNQIDEKLDAGTASGTYAPLNSPTFGGNVSLPSTTTIGNVSATEIGYIDGVTSSVQTQLNSKAPINDPSFQISQMSLGTPTLLNDPNYPTEGISAGVTTYFSTGPNFDLEFFVEGALDFIANSTIGFLNSEFSGQNINGVLFTTGTPYAESGAYLLPITANSSDAATVNAWLNVIGGGFSYGLPDFSVAVATIGPSIAISSAEIKTLDGVTSNIQTQLNAKASAADLVDVEAALDTKANLSGANFTGNVEVDGNIVVDGNLTVNGTEFIASATSITIEDNIIQIAHTNPANTVDLGVVVAYNDGTAQHAGIVRDVSDNTWKLFKGVETEPATTVAFGEGSLDDLELNNIKAAGVVFPDGIQTKQGIPSLTNIVQHTGPTEYTPILTDRDKLIEVSSASTTIVRIPLNSNVAFPVGTSFDILQTGNGQVVIDVADGVTVNATPGLKLRTQWSSATLFKRAENTWVAYGDLTV